MLSDVDLPVFGFFLPFFFACNPARTRRVRTSPYIQPREEQNFSKPERTWPRSGRCVPRWLFFQNSRDHGMIWYGFVLENRASLRLQDIVSFAALHIERQNLLANETFERECQTILLATQQTS